MFRPASLLALVVISLASAGAQITPALPSSPTVTALPGQGGRVRLDFGMSSDVKEVLDLYTRLTKKRILHDAQMAGPVPIKTKEEVPVEEAIKLMEMALQMNGFSLVPSEDKISLKAISLGKNPRTQAVPLFTDVDLIPDTEQIVTVLFRLQFADPQELQAMLAQAFPASPAMAGAGAQTVVPLLKSGALLVTENTPILRQMARIIRELDEAAEPAKVVSRFFKLQRADAKDVQEKLENILTKQQAGATGAPGGGAVPRPQVVRMATTPEGLPLPGNAPPSEGSQTVEISIGPNEENFVAGKVKITADVRTNRLHVIARRKAMDDIARLIEEFDENIPFGVPEVRPLQHVTAADIFQVLVRAVSEPGQDAGSGAGAGGAGGARPRNTGASSGLTGTTGSAVNRGGGGQFGGEGGFGSGSGNGSGGQTFSEGLTATEREVAPEAVTIGNTRLIADNRTNSIIVIGNRDVREKVFKIIDKLDVRAPQVMLYTCIGQLTLNNNEQFSVDYILNKGGRVGTGVTTPNNNGGGGGTGTGGNGTGGTTNTGGTIGFDPTSGAPGLNLSALLNQRAIRQIATVGGTGLTGFFTAGNAFNAIVTALESTSRFKVTSRPSIFASNNKKAVISSGQEIAIPTNIQSGFGGGNANGGLVTNSSIQFKTVALTLEIIPVINSNKEVTLDIVQKIQEQVDIDVIDNNRIPRIATRDLKTTVTIPNEATLVLGGLIRQSATKTRSGIPYLSRIPYIGGLFGSTTNSKVRDELVILIRPVVMNFPNDSVRVREKEMETYNLDHDLESTLTPQGVRQRVPAETVQLRQTSVLKLREERSFK